MSRRLLLTFTLMAGCASDSQSPETAVERGPLDEARSVGSCAGTDCDGNAPGGNCWCDDACIEFGDCCSDRVDVCEAPVTLACGGTAALDCSAGFFCEFGADAMCGSADEIGVCREIPSSCVAVLSPVCGCDGQTYGNSCEAAMAGVSVASQGACEEDTAQSCGGLFGQACSADSFCNFELAEFCGAADAAGTCEPMPEFCPAVVDPVCGCDNRTYNNECEANRAGVAAAALGPCDAESAN
jgi:hypothetical protein